MLGTDGANGPTVGARGERVEDRASRSAVRRPACGVQTSRRRRLGVSPGPVGVERTGNGDLRYAGRARRRVVDAVGAARRACARSIAAAIVCGPAVTFMRVGAARCSVTRSPSSVT